MCPESNILHFDPRRADLQQKLHFKHGFSLLTCLMGLSQHLQKLETRLSETYFHLKRKRNQAQVVFHSLVKIKIYLDDLNIQIFPPELNLPKRPLCRGLRAGTAAPAPGSFPTVPFLRPAAATSRAASSAGLRRTEAGTASLCERSGTRTWATAF